MSQVPPPLPPMGTPGYPPPGYGPPLGGPVLICNNPGCGHQGPTRVEEHGSVAAAIVMMVLCMLLPGLLYLLLGCYKTYHCARCNVFLQKASLV